MAKMGWSDLSPLGQASIIGSIGGGITSMIGAGTEANYRKYLAKKQALDYEHKRDMDLFNMDMKESQAQWMNRSFNINFAQKTNRMGRRKSRRNVNMAARGGVRGVGSNLALAVTEDLFDEVDKITMNSKKIKALNDKRLEAVGLGISADRHALNANTSYKSAASISTFSAMSSSLLNSASSTLSMLPKEFFMAA